MKGLAHGADLDGLRAARQRRRDLRARAPRRPEPRLHLGRVPRAVRAALRARCGSRSVMSHDGLIVARHRSPSYAIGWADRPRRWLVPFLNAAVPGGAWRPSCGAARCGAPSTVMLVWALTMGVVSTLDGRRRAGRARDDRRRSVPARDVPRRDDAVGPDRRRAPRASRRCSFRGISAYAAVFSRAALATGGAAGDADGRACS